MRTHRSGGCPSTQSRQANPTASPPPPRRHHLLAPPPSTPTPPPPPPALAPNLCRGTPRVMVAVHPDLDHLDARQSKPGLSCQPRRSGACPPRVASRASPRPQLSRPCLCPSLRAPPRDVAPRRRRCGRRRTSSRRRCRRLLPAPPLPPPPPPPPPRPPPPPPPPSPGWPWLYAPPCPDPPCPRPPPAPCRLRPWPPLTEGWVPRLCATASLLSPFARLPGWKVRAPKPGGHVMM